MNSKLRLLLQLIEAQADTSYLTRQGLVFSQISALFGEALEQGMLEYDGSSFHITESGQARLQEAATSAAEGHQGRWISSNESYVIPQIGIDEVYLPNKKHSYFS